MRIVAFLFVFSVGDVFWRISHWGWVWCTGQFMSSRGRFRLLLGCNVLRLCLGAGRFSQFPVIELSCGHILVHSIDEGNDGVRREVSAQVSWGISGHSCLRICWGSLWCISVSGSVCSKGFRYSRLCISSGAWLSRRGDLSCLGRIISRRSCQRKVCR